MFLMKLRNLEVFEQIVLQREIILRNTQTLVHDDNYFYSERIT